MTSRLKMKRIHKEVTVHGSWGLCRLVRLGAAYTAEDPGAANSNRKNNFNEKQP